MRIDDSSLSRRRFICGLLGTGGAALGAMAGVPVASYLLRPEPLPDFMVLERADYDLAPGESKILLFGNLPALIFKTPANELKTFVAVCTHFDCTVMYRREENDIFCACHEGLYDADGRVLDGPPPRPLTQFHRRFRGEQLVIALEEEKLERAFAAPAG